MMKKLIFCLLVLTGAGMLNSCQQDEVVNEAPASKGVTIRASLPNDAQSRVELGETSNGKTPVLWKAGDQIKVTINGTEYTFTTRNSGTTATFTCAELDESTTLSAGTYTFTYGQQPTAGNVQTGTEDGLKDYLYMTASYTAQEGATWNNVDLKFSTQVALAKISLGNITATSVSMYNKDGGLVVSTPTSGNHTFTDNVYFALTQGTYNNIFLQIDTATDVYTKKMNDIQLVANKLYSIDNNINSGINYSVIGDDKTLYVYGHGAIPDYKFTSNTVQNPEHFTFGSNVVILSGITSIGDHAFYGNSIDYVSIPATVTSIGEDAFANNSLVTYTFKGNIAPSLGGSSAFGLKQNATFNASQSFIENAKTKQYWSGYLN